MRHKMSSPLSIGLAEQVYLGKLGVLVISVMAMSTVTP